jgi:DNA replication and repair protein RecF
LNELLRLRQLRLTHFRNYPTLDFPLSAPLTILVGENAQGKSNLLEAIFLLATLRSHRVSRDSDMVEEGHDLAEIQAQCFALDLRLVLPRQGRRRLSINGVSLTKQQEFLGHLQAVLFSSLDLDLVRGSPEIRRQWLDGILLQLEPLYWSVVQQYQQILRQRNALLKGIKLGHFRPDPTQMAAWNDQLAIAGTKVMRRRARLLLRLTPLAQRWHQNISGDRELLTLTYAPRHPVPTNDEPQAWQDAFLSHLEARTLAETQQGTTLVGPHRDDVQLHINAAPAREFGSQGQQRTLVLALKLAELELLETVHGHPPLLLLDDVFAELDLRRQQELLSAIAPRTQTLLTTTHLGTFDRRWLDNSAIFTVTQGTLAPL